MHHNRLWKLFRAQQYFGNVLLFKGSCVVTPSYSDIGVIQRSQRWGFFTRSGVFQERLGFWGFLVEKWGFWNTTWVFLSKKGKIWGFFDKKEKNVFFGGHFVLEDVKREFELNKNRIFGWGKAGLVGLFPPPVVECWRLPRGGVNLWTGKISICIPPSPVVSSARRGKKGLLGPENRYFVTFWDICGTFSVFFWGKKLGFSGVFLGRNWVFFPEGEWEHCAVYRTGEFQSLAARDLPYTGVESNRVWLPGTCRIQKWRVSEFDCQGPAVCIQEWRVSKFIIAIRSQSVALS